MILTGLIFQFNNEQGSGLVMLSDGQTHEFTKEQWVDESCEPSLGLAISYEDLGYTKRVMNSNSKNVQESAQDEEADGKIPKYNSFEEYIDYFIGKDFKLTKDLGEGDERKITMRMYSMDDYGEVNISYLGSKINVNLVMNGKKIS